MIYKARISVQREGLAEILAAETFAEGRSKVTIKEGKGGLAVEISASDATALRAAMNAVLRLIIIDEKMRGI
jgi:tRNA threonylcarbamoyladenosine modification (KEOPS) complex  Pcc1 subunit